MKIGVISDTHGLLRPEAVQALQGSELIIHAGDIGKPGVLDMLREIAPVIAVRGNIDKDDWAKELPITEVVEIKNKYIYVLHDLSQLDLDPKAAGFDVVISGHSHKPKEERRDGVIYLNPGSAGPRRFNLPVSLALMEIEDEEIDVRFINLSKEY
jgi:putative phosphoesterase